MNKPLILAALLPLVTTACGAFERATVQSAKTSLHGASAERLETCIGEPAKLVTQGHQTVVKYSSAQQRAPNGLTLATPGATDDPKACVFTFTVENGLIRHITSEHRAGWGGGGIKNCSAIVKNCTFNQQ
jgi:hypothetical protein